MGKASRVYIGVKLRRGGVGVKLGCPIHAKYLGAGHSGGRTGVGGLGSEVWCGEGSEGAWRKHALDEME